MMSYLWLLLFASLLAGSAKAQDDAAPEKAVDTTVDPEAEAAADESADVLDKVEEDTEAGDKDAPETDAPETDAPQTDAPETDAPQTDAPETDAPETDAPETDAPETDAPETDAPETDAPETEAPETEAPETEAPGAEALETEAPETEAPETEAPGAEALETEAPETEAPGAEALETEAPGADGVTNATADKHIDTTETTERDDAPDNTEATAVLDAETTATAKEEPEDGGGIDDTKGTPASIPETKIASEALAPETEKESEADDTAAPIFEEDIVQHFGRRVNVEGPSGFDLTDGLPPTSPPQSGKSRAGAGGTPEAKQSSSGALAAIVTTIGVAAVGAVTGYFTYQKKKLCFKERQDADPEAARKADTAEAKSDPQVLSNLLNSS